MQIKAKPHGKRGFLQLFYGLISCCLALVIVAGCGVVVTPPPNFSVGAKVYAKKDNSYIGQITATGRHTFGNSSQPQPAAQLATAKDPHRPIWVSLHTMHEEYYTR